MDCDITHYVYPYAAQVFLQSFEKKKKSCWVCVLAVSRPYTRIFGTRLPSAQTASLPPVMLGL